MPPIPQDGKPSHAWRPRYGVGGLLRLMLVCSVTAACGYYLLRATRGGRQSQAVFIVFTLVAPLLLVVLVSTLRSIWDRLQQ